MCSIIYRACKFKQQWRNFLSVKFKISGRKKNHLKEIQGEMRYINCMGNFETNHGEQ